MVYGLRRHGVGFLYERAHASGAEERIETDERGPVGSNNYHRSAV